MKDAEINVAIAKIEYPDHGVTGAPFSDNRKNCAVINCLVLKDYINNWSDIGEIIEREKIAVSYSAKYKCWYAQDLYYEDLPDLDNTCSGAYAETPTKAAALCYLKMKGVE